MAKIDPGSGVHPYYQDRTRTGFISKIHEFQRRKKLGSQDSHRMVKQIKPPSHIEKMMFEMAIFKKKIEIDDEENRLGPSNKVNLPQENSLYFNTNIL